MTISVNVQLPILGSKETQVGLSMSSDDAVALMAELARIESPSELLSQIKDALASNLNL